MALKFNSISLLPSLPGHPHLSWVQVLYHTGVSSLSSPFPTLNLMRHKPLLTPSPLYRCKHRGQGDKVTYVWSLVRDSNLGSLVPGSSFNCIYFVFPRYRPDQKQTGTEHIGSPAVMPGSLPCPLQDPHQRGHRWKSNSM